jgi:hypothetical protein
MNHAVATAPSGRGTLPIRDLSGNQRIWMLHARTYRGVVLVCAAAFIALPAVCAVVWLLGGAALVVGSVALLLVIVVTYVLLIGGIIAAILGLFGGGEGAAIVILGVIAAILGFALKTPVDTWQHEWPNVCNQLIDQMQMYSQILLGDYFVDQRVYALAWVPLCALSAAGLVLLATVWIVNSIARVRRRWKGVRYACTQCDRNQVLAHQCPKCKALIEGLAASSKGLFHASCPSCGCHIPTVGISGLWRIKRCCKHCGHDSHPAGWGNCRETTVLKVDLDQAAPSESAVPQVRKDRQQITYIYHLTNGDLLKETEFAARQVVANVDRVVLNIDQCKPAYQLTQTISNLITAIEVAQKRPTNRRSPIPTFVVGRAYEQLRSQPDWQALRQLLDRRFRRVAWSHAL